MSGGRSDIIRSFKDLEVWQVAIELSVAVYEATKSFPREELYGLSAQMRRASVSIASNIAEGYGRESTGAYIQFLKIAQSSTKELETQIVISERIGLLTTQNNLQPSLDSIGRMLRALIRSLERGA